MSGDCWLNTAYSMEIFLGRRVALSVLLRVVRCGMKLQVGWKFFLSVG